MIGKCRPCLVWIEVEECGVLHADEVVRAAWAAAGYADGLRVCQAALEGFVVDGGYAVETEADGEEDEGW